jgi:succinoglycan biosynthesis protein ExoA
MSQREFVSIVIPTLNEERYIARAIRSIQPSLRVLDFEILVMDGGSTDFTKDIVLNIAETEPRIKFLSNPKRLQSAGVNLGAEMADPRARVIVRADSHAVYPEGFVERLLAALVENSAVSVVVPMKNLGLSCRQKGIAAAQSSRLGNGGAPHRTAGKSRLVDHGHHAAFHRGVFSELGGYDESFAANEDAELDIRIREAGGRIWLQADCPVTYFPRSTFATLARQYFKHGRGRAMTFLKHRQRPLLRQILPLLAFAANALAIALSFVASSALLVPLIYAAVCLSAGLIKALTHRSLCLLAVGPALMTMHMSWAVGFLSQYFRSRKQFAPPPGAAARDEGYETSIGSAAKPEQV